MGKILVVTSGKGGVGKSTVSVGLAAAFCENHNRVLLIDADEGLRCLDAMLGAERDVMLDVGDVQFDASLTDRAAVSVPRFEGLHLLAAPSVFGRVDATAFGEMLGLLSGQYDVLIVDCPAGVDEKYYTCLPEESEILLVTNSDAAAVNGAMQAGLMVRRLGFDKIRLILNKFSRKTVGKLHRNVDEIVDTVGVGLIGIVPYDREIVVAAASSETAKYGRAAMAFARIAARLFGERVFLPNVRNI